MIALAALMFVPMLPSATVSIAIAACFEGASRNLPMKGIFPGTLPSIFLTPITLRPATGPDSVGNPES